MTTIHLSDAQRDTFAACGLIVIDGELDDATYWDCVGGRRVVTLKATCPKCHGDGGYIVHDDQGDECRHGRCRTCGAGMEGGGVVTLGRFTIPALGDLRPGQFIARPERVE